MSGFAVGDRVQITKPDHLDCGCFGVVSSHREGSAFFGVTVTDDYGDMYGDSFSASELKLVAKP